jgi:hypothetical protein
VGNRRRMYLSLNTESLKRIVIPVRADHDEVADVLRES